MDRDEIIEIVENVIAFNENHKDLDGLFIRMEFLRDDITLWLKEDELTILDHDFSGSWSFYETVADLEKWAKKISA